MFTCKCELKIFPKPWTMRKKRLRQNDYIFLFGGWLSSKLIFLFSTNIIKFLFLKLELSLHSCRASILGGSRPRQIYPKLGKYYLEDKKLPKFHRFGALCFEFHALMLFQYIWNSSCFPSLLFFFFSLFYQPKEIHSLFYSNGRKHALMWVHKSHIQRSSYHQINFVEDLSRWVNSNVSTINVWP